jgi:hypothetical protein
VLQAAGADAVKTLFVFLDLLECQPQGVRNIGSNSISRRIRKRLPTCLSIGFGAFIGICASSGCNQCRVRLMGHNAAKPRKPGLL